MTIYPSDGNAQTVVDAAAKKTRNSSNQQSDTEFRKQLVVQAGDKAVQDSKAKRFNENGFFRSVAVDTSGSRANLISGTAHRSINEPASVQRSDDAVAKRMADIAHAFKSMEIEALKEFLAEILDNSPRNSDVKVHKIEAKSPAKRIEFAETRPMASPDVMTQRAGSSLLTAGKPSSPAQSSSSISENPVLSQSQSLIAQKAAIAEHMLKDQMQKARAPIKLAVSELENGIKLTAEIRHLSKEKREAVKNELLSLLALHGMGNYDLQLDGELFINRITGREDHP